MMGALVDSWVCSIAHVHSLSRNAPTCITTRCSACGFTSSSCSTAKASSSFVTRGVGLRALSNHRWFRLDWSIHPQFLRQGNERCPKGKLLVCAQSKQTVEDAAPYFLQDLESDSEDKSVKKSNRRSSNSGASSVSSGVRLEHISKTFKGAQVLKDVSWEVKKGERVGLVGVNGAGACSSHLFLSRFDAIAGLM